MHERLKLFIEDLRFSDNHRKKRWLIGLSAVTMTLVIMLWSVYIQQQISGFAEKTPVETADDRSHVSIFAAGLKEIQRQIGRGISTTVANVKSIIGETKSIEVTKPVNDFTADAIPAVPVTPLVK